MNKMKKEQNGEWRNVTYLIRIWLRWGILTSLRLLILPEAFVLGMKMRVWVTIIIGTATPGILIKLNITTNNRGS